MRTEQQGLPQYLTEDELARTFSLGVGTLRLWRRNKTGPPYFKLGGSVRYDAEEVRAWIKKGRKSK